MKTTLLFSLLLAASAPAFAQQPVYESVSRMPEFSGDVAEYMSQHLEYTPAAVSGDLKGPSVVRFVVSPTGEISSAATTQSCGDKAMDSLARRAVLNMPRWKPGTQDGAPVAVYSKVTVRPAPKPGAKVDDAVVAWANNKAQADVAFQAEQERQRVADAQKEEATRAEAARANAAEYRAQCVKAFGAKDGAKIAAGEVWLGMTKSQAEMAWGSPSRTNQSLIKGKRADVWYYSGSERWLAFANGKLISITK